MTDDLRSFDTLVKTVSYLRSGDGCPWDREQTHSSVKHSLLEECYEVLEAIDNADPKNLAEELGDILLQVVFHAQIGTDQKEFTIEDVLHHVNEKIRKRHPHVFGNLQVANAAEVKVNWDRIKQKERGDASILSGLAKEMPALAYSQAAQSRSARANFDWDTLGGVLSKVAEEIFEFQNAGSPESQAEELGDVLFTLVNVARWLGIQAEDSLRQANRRFTNRFSYMEELCRKQGLNFVDLPRNQKELLWQEAKEALASERQPNP